MKKKKGGKSKGNKKKKTFDKEQKDVLAEVDQEYFEIQITDLTQKLTRLRGRNSELSVENTDLRNRYQHLDEDRADIIAHLTRLLDEKTKECEEVQERLEALEKFRDQDQSDFSKKMGSLQQEYTSMNNRLQAEIKLLKGKLNSLEEFRQAKEELMKNFEEQEENFKLQKQQHENQLNEVEKQFILDRDRLQKELEKRLLELSEDFQQTFQLRIASHTQRVIRENVAVNNELSALMTSWKKIMDENLQLKNENVKLKVNLKIVETNQNEIYKTNMHKDKLILDLKSKYVQMKNKYSEITNYENLNKDLEENILYWKEKYRTATNKIQELSNQLNEQTKLVKQEDSKLYNTKSQLEKLQNIVCHAAEAIKDTVEVQSQELIEQKKSERHKLILTLLEILNTPHMHKTQSPREEIKKSKMSLEKLNQYEQGSLGIIPKSDEEIEKQK